MLPSGRFNLLHIKNQKQEIQMPKKPRKEWDISKTRWNSLGVKDSMSIEQARSRAKQINCQNEIKRQESRRKKIEDQKIELQQQFSAQLL